MIAVLVAILLLVVGFCGFVAEKMLLQSTDSYAEIPSLDDGGFRLYSRCWGWAEQACDSMIVLLSAYQLVFAFEQEEGSLGNHAFFLLFMFVVLYDSMHPPHQSKTMKAFRSTLSSSILVYSLVNCSEEYCLASLLMVITATFGLSFHVKSSYFNSFKIVSTAPTAEYTCDLFSYISFAYLTPILIDPGCKKTSIDFEDLPGLSDIDSAERSWIIFRDHMNLQTNNGTEKEKLNLILCIFHLIKREWLFQGLFHFVQSCAKFTTPLALQRILLYVSNSPQSEAVLPVSIHVAVLMLFVSPFVESIAENQNERTSG